MKDEEARPAPGAPKEPPPRRANGSTLWKAKDPLGCEIVLDAETEKHILEGHPEMKGYLDALKLTIEKPALIQRDETVFATCYYYRLAGRNFHKHKDIYLNVVVDRQESVGRIKTAFLIKHLRSNPGELLWIQKS
jgi:hypothetical protein